MLCGIGNLISTANAIDNKEKVIWLDRLNKEGFISNLDILNEENIPCFSLDVLLYTIYLSTETGKRKRYIAYGGGRLAERYIKLVKEKVKIEEIWDTYTDKASICDIQIVRPHILEDTYVAIIFIKDSEMRHTAQKTLREFGVRDFIYVYDFLGVVSKQSIHVNVNSKESCEKLIEEFMDRYEFVDHDSEPVLFSLISRSDDDLEKISKEIEIHFSFQQVKEQLCERLIIKECGEWINMLEMFSKSTYQDFPSFLVAFEKILRIVLNANVKTKERPIRMTDDTPYDQFAVSETIFILVDAICNYNASLACEIIDRMLEYASQSLPLTAVWCRFKILSSDYQDALSKARELVRCYPNNLLVDETFYKVATACKENGVYVEEQLPQIDLSEYFCWSGITFAWCGGFDQVSDAPDFRPCFRPLQCAAKPSGDFWVSDEWKEFRKSLIDGSFRYCSKNQCTNIVSGWLPKKSECDDERLRILFEGNYELIPDLEELHFSYDSHCNLKCPSCRLEMQTNSKETNKELDFFYEKYLKKYVEQAKHLCLSGCGEAILSPHSKKIIQSLSVSEYPNLEVELRTNMTVLNQNTWESLGDGRHVIKHIAASIDGATKETFEKLRYPAKWDVVCENLKFVQKLRNDNEIDMFEIHVVVQRSNIDELLEIVKLAINYGADAITFSRIVNWRNMSRKEYDLIDPFWIKNDINDRLLREIERIERLRADIESGKYRLPNNRKKFYINMHFSPDPNHTYKTIRTGKIRIR